MPFLETFGSTTEFGSLTSAPLPCAFRQMPKSPSLTAAIGINTVTSPNGKEFTVSPFAARYDGSNTQ